MSEITRKLASIQRVTALDPIEGADRIEVASVLGWQMVVQKGLYQVDDLVVFYEIDAFLPIQPQYEFLRKSSYRVTKELGEGYRIKTCKLRGQISQGLLMPMHETGMKCPPITGETIEGLDVTEELGVRKYEPNQSVLLSGIAVGSFPSFVPKTDEPRVQNLTREKQAWANDIFVATLKEDGSSMTVFVELSPQSDGISDNWRVGVCSRNWEVKDEGGNTYWKVAKEIGLVAGLQQSGLRVAVQGELVGPGVQGNPGKYDKLHFKIFNIWMIGEKRYLTVQERHEWVAAFNLLFKSELEEVDSDDLYPVQGVISDQTMLDYFITIMTKGEGDIEGIVFKSIEHPERSYKYINPTYNLKHDD
jgi:RNA ligase (TIGR02306 family)